VTLTVTIGRSITVAREAASMSKGELARMMGVDRRAVTRWEAGQHRPTDTNLAAMAELFGRDVGWFFSDHGNA
jgi:transcriptional regulator with XRE-family HTH domain